MRAVLSISSYGILGEGGLRCDAPALPQSGFALLHQRETESIEFLAGAQSVALRATLRAGFDPLGDREQPGPVLVGRPFGNPREGL
jgi:hypothetical protein